MNEGDFIFVEGIGPVQREVLLRNPELLSHEASEQRRHEEWLAEAEASRRERARAELERVAFEAEFEESERALHEIEGDGEPGNPRPAPFDVRRHPRRGAAEAQPPAFPKTRSEAEQDAAQGEPGPHHSDAETGASVRLGTPPSGNARYCRHCRAQLPEGTRRRGSVQEFCSSKHKAAWHRKKKARTATTGLDIIAALEDKKLLGAALGELGTWRSWLIFLRSLFGLELDAEQLELFELHTGRSVAPSEQAREAWVVAGRRGGKSRIAALIAVYIAAFRDFSSVLAPGERGVVMLLAADRKLACSYGM